MDNPFLEANINLNKKIDELEKENRELVKFKEMYMDLERHMGELVKELDKKNTVARVFYDENNIRYALPIVQVATTREGMYVVVALSEKFLKGK